VRNPTLFCVDSTRHRTIEGGNLLMVWKRLERTARDIPVRSSDYAVFRHVRIRQCAQKSPGECRGFSFAAMKDQ
jgi:hypothetical protein